MNTQPLSQSEQAWILLNNAVGRYYGTGSNHERQTFEARFVLASEIPNKLISVKYEAKGPKGENFHEEISWIGRDVSGSLTLLVNSNNHKGMTPHYFHRLAEMKNGPKKLVFRHGDPDDRFNFREEVTFAVHTNYNVEYVYAWGTAGGNFEVRSTAVMKKMI